MFDPRTPRPTASSLAARPAPRKQEVVPNPVADADPLGHITLDRLNLWMETFCDTALNLHGQSPESTRGYVDAYRCFRKFLLDPSAMPSTELRDRLFAIDAWTAWNRRRGVGAVSCNTYWRGLRSFFRYLAASQGLPNPFEGLKAPGLPAYVPKALSPDECRRLLSAAKNYPWQTAFERTRAVALMGIMVYSGLRKGEVLRLLFADLDLRDATLRVERGKGRYGGKDRVCVIPPELKFLLQDYLRERDAMGITCPEFFASRLHQGLSEKQFKRTIEAVKRASGIHFSAHALRHSFICMALRAGIPLHVVQAMAGHASIESTIPYIRVFDSEKHDAARKLQLLKL